MPNYFLTTRTIRHPKNKPAYFDNESSEPSYLASPSNAKSLNPDHRYKGAGRRERWAKEIIEKAKRPDGSGDIIFLVHGYNNDTTDTVTAHKKLSSNIKEEGMPHAVFVSYAWPSEGNFVEYLEDDHDARTSAIDLVTSGLSLFAAATEPGCRIKVHVMAHSMGALVVREAIRAAQGHGPTREAAWGINQLILYAADISARSFGGDSARPMIECAQRVTNYFNRHDEVLATSNVKRFLSSPRLGRHGAPQEMLSKIADVDVTEYWSNLSQNNATGLIADIPKSHSFYQTNRQFARDVALTLKGDIDRRHLETRALHDKEEGRLMLKT